MPRVSVVIPAYNSEATLAVALGSIFTQTFDDLEVIVVYDDSKDATVTILQALSAEDSRLRFFRNPEAGNVLRRMPAALNFGLEMSNGEFVARMDADDVALPDRIATQVAFLDAHPDVALCGMGMRLINQAGDAIRDLMPVYGSHRTRVMAHYAPPLYHPTWIFRRAILEKLKGYRDMYTEDYDFLLRALEAGYNLDNCPQIGLLYRIHPAHRSSLQAHKSNEFAYRMHKRRLGGQPDGFSVAASRAAVAPSRWPRLERLGHNLMERGFTVEERNRLLGSLLVILSLLFLPSSAKATLRKIQASVRLALIR